MTTKDSPLSRFMQVDTSTSRMRRLWVSIERRIGATPKARRRPVFALVTALGFLVGGLTVYGWFTFGSYRRGMNSGTSLQTANDQLTVEIGSGATLRLAARTRVYLDTADSHTSAVRLQSGSITCDVNSRHQHRFSVLVDDLEIRDTGTRFSVSRDSATGEVDVNVERGSVQIFGAAPKDTKSLAAGEHWARRGKGAIEAASPPVQPTKAPAEPHDDHDAGSADHNPGPVAIVTNHGAKPIPDPARDSTEAPSPLSLFEQANAARRAGNPVEAGRALQTLITLYPNDTRVGLAALELGRLRMGLLADVPGAVRAFRVALTHAPNTGFREDALAHLVEAYAALGDAGSCAALRQKYLDEYPKGVHRAMVERKCKTP